MSENNKKEEAVDMFATPMQKAIIIDPEKTKEFAEKLLKNVPTKEFWEECKQDADSLDMERLNRLYDGK